MTAKRFTETLSTAISDFLLRNFLLRIFPILPSYILQEHLEEMRDIMKNIPKKKRFYIEESENQDTIFDDTADDDYYHLGNDTRDVKALCKLLNQLDDENKQLKSDLAKVIEQAKENDKFLRSDIRILENALWCPNCANDIKRLKELRKEFKQ